MNIYIYTVLGLLQWYVSVDSFQFVQSVIEYTWIRINWMPTSLYEERFLLHFQPGFQPYQPAAKNSRQSLMKLRIVRREYCEHAPFCHNIRSSNNICDSHYHWTLEKSCSSHSDSTIQLCVMLVFSATPLRHSYRYSYQPTRLPVHPHWVPLRLVHYRT
jgi:hypothetical protein